MKPIDQTRFAINAPLTEAPGNCWAACIASILECSLSSVPDEADFWKPGMSHRQSWRLYEPAVHAYLRSKGIAILEIKVEKAWLTDRNFDAFCIISGPSPRNLSFHHAVVGRMGEIVHDPHDSRQGLVGDPDVDWWYEFFIPLDVASFIRVR